MQPFQIISLLQHEYGLDAARIESRLQTNGQREAYLIGSGQEQFVLKVTDPHRPEEIVKSDVGILGTLARVNFPAPRPIAARGGQLYLPFEDRFLYLYSYIAGEHPRAAPDFYIQLGKLLAWLHSIPLEDSDRRSLYRPGYLLEDVKRQLSETPHEPDQQAMASEVLEMIERFPSFKGLPEGLIHTDPYFVNLIQMGSGGLALIDWEDAGISYLLMDIGYIGHLTTFLSHDRVDWSVPGEGEITWRPDWAQVFLDAYQSVRSLTDLEKELFPAAVRLNFLVYLWDWKEQHIIGQNFRRMKLLESFQPVWRS